MQTMFKDISDKEILDKLKDLAQNENDFDNSVQWNKFNHVVQSHVDGTLYISVDKVLKFIRYREHVSKEESAYERNAEIEVEPATFKQELERLINRNSKENESNTPDYILAEYLDNCLKSFDSAVNIREKHFGRINNKIDNIEL